MRKSATPRRPPRPSRAAHVAHFETWVRRVTGVPMERRAVLAAYEAGSGRYTVYAGNGGAVRLKNDVAAILDVPADKVRVLMQDVGGNFGTRGMIYPEFPPAWASRRVGRPVKRTIVPQRLPGARPRRRGRTRARRTGQFPRHARRQSRQPRRPQHQLRHGAEGRRDHVEHLRVAAAHFRARPCSATARRSAGRPEVIFVIERLIDVAAAQAARCRRSPSSSTPSSIALGVRRAPHRDAGDARERMAGAQCRRP